MRKTKSIEEFVREARAVHGEKYTYSKTVYKTSKVKVVITCPKHGDYEQMPLSHLAGNGCKDCGRISTTNARRKTTEIFIEKANRVHGSVYDYSQVNYTHAHEKITIICRKHGAFQQAPTKHVNGKSPRGCPLCGRQKLADEQRGSLSSFVEKASRAHGDKYDYSQVVYRTARKNVAIVCPMENHGIFYQTPDSHAGKKASGCPKCAHGDVASTDDFIRVSSLKHYEKYDYGKTVWVKAKEPVIISCPFHGDFSQQPQHHQTGIGCPHCGDEIRQIGDLISDLERAGKDYDGVFYVLESWNKSEHFFKVGITRDMNRRYSRAAYMPYDYDVLATFPVGLIKAYKTEQRILSDFAKNSYEPVIAFAGRTECLSINPLENDQELGELLRLYS